VFRRFSEYCEYEDEIYRDGSYTAEYHILYTSL
jgi:hypothetical protein